MNNLQVNFSGLLPGSDDVTRDVRPGCVTEDRMDSCSDVTCVHGQCVFEEVGSRCKCDEGYLGTQSVFCEFVSLIFSCLSAT